MYPADLNICEMCEPNCEVRSDNTTCTLCSDGFLTYNGDCVLDCPSGTFKIDG